MEKLKREQTMFSVLRTLAYCIGFPLLMLVVLLCSTNFMHQDIYNNTWFLGLVICFIPWLLATILQVVFGRFVKNQNIKTLVVAVVIVAVMLGSAGVLDLYGNSTIKKMQEKYSADKYAAVDIPEYKYQVGWFVTVSDVDSLNKEFLRDVNHFSDVYYLFHNGYQFGDENADGTIPSKGVEKGLGLTDCYVSPNGMLDEGWTFSVKQAVSILITYHEAINNSKEKFNIDLVAQYNSLLLQVENSPEYVAYTATEEYQMAYGENGSANKHMITEDRIDLIMPIVVVYLEKVVDNVLSIVGSLGDGFKDVLELDELSKVTTLDDLIDNYLPIFATNLDSILSGIVDSNPLLDESGNLIITKDFIMNLVKEYSYYYSPTCRPVFDFIAEAIKAEGSSIALENNDGEVITCEQLVEIADELQRFGYANYYATIHGKNCGSVLIGENIGQVTMSDKGYPSEYFAYSLDELYQLEADLSYVTILYPLLAARRYLYVFAGICALSIILFYHFLRREKDKIEEIRVYKGGAL